MAASLPSVLIEQLFQYSLLGGDRLELTWIGCGVERAVNRVKFTQVNGENLHAILLLWESGLRFLLLWGKGSEGITECKVEGKSLYSKPFSR
jgi:hypothetical protein